MESMQSGDASSIRWVSTAESLLGVAEVVGVEVVWRGFCHVNRKYAKWVVVSVMNSVYSNSWTFAVIAATKGRSIE